MQLQIREDNGILRCEGHLDIRSVEELRGVLSQCFDRNSCLMLDLSALDGCDTAGLQLLYAARKQANDCGKQLEIQAASIAIQNIALSLGIPIEALGHGVASV